MEVESIVENVVYGKVKNTAKRMDKGCTLPKYRCGSGSILILLKSVAV